MSIVTVYTKPNCSLCDDAIEAIEAVKERFPFRLDVRDILQSFADYERYKHDVPVIFFNGRELARHRIDRDRLIAALQRTGDCG